MLSAISNRIVQIQREHYGRGPMKAKTYALDDLIVVVMRGSGFTPLEKTMMDSGDPERVVAMRHDFQHMMTKLFTDTIEELTGRKVLAFLSQAAGSPVAVAGGPLVADAAVEATAGEEREHPARPQEHSSSTAKSGPPRRPL